MKSLLKIRQPKNSAHIYWEHAMKSVFAFVVAFAVVFFGPIFMVAGSDYEGQQGVVVERDLGFMGWLLEHPEIQVSISLLVVLIYNIIIIRKNSRKNYLVSLESDGIMARLGLTSLAYKVVDEIVIPISDLEVEVLIKRVEKKETVSAFKFFDNKFGEVVAVIKPDYIIWNTQVKDVKMALFELDKLGVKKSKSTKDSRPLISWIFPK